MQDRGRKIFNAFLIIVASTFMFLLPLTTAVEKYKTYQQEDIFSVTTGVGETVDNITFSETLYEGDSTSVTILSDLSTDATGWNSYNSTYNNIGLTGLTASEVRVITATYDVDALGGNAAIITLVDRLAWLWLLICIAYAPAALAAIFTGRA